MANSAIKIIYFNIPGRAEVCRMLLIWSGKVFEDVRVSGEQWREIKPTTPFGTCPVLVLDDGKMYGQSKAIAAYLASEFGLYGETNLDKFLIDQIVHLTEDLIQEYGNRYFFEKDEAKKAEGEKQLKEETCPRFLGYYEKLLRDNGTGYLVGNKISLADFTVYDVCTGFLGPVVAPSVDKFPSVKQLVEMIDNDGRIRAYKEKTNVPK